MHNYEGKGANDPTTGVEVVMKKTPIPGRPLVLSLVCCLTSVALILEYAMFNISTNK